MKPGNDMHSDNYLPVLVLLPFLAAVASSLGIRNLMIATFLIIGSLVFLVVLKADVAVQDRVFPLAIGCMSLSLILSSNLVSNNLSGADIQVEFNIFQQVSKAGFWRPEPMVYYGSGSAPYYSALSISILPTIIREVTWLPDATTLQFGSSILWALGPVVLYKLYRKFLEPRHAFVSVFLFMSYPTFYGEMIALARQEIAELLLIVLLCFLFYGTVRTTRARALIVTVLTFGIITAHYSIGYLTIAILGVSWIAPRISRKVSSLSMGLLLIGSVVMAAGWYALAAGGVAALGLANFVSFTANHFLEDFINPNSRPTMVLQALGLASVTPGLLHDLNRVTQYSVLFCMVVGFLVFLGKNQKSLTERQMIPLTVAGFCLLFASVIVPYFAAALNLSRFYSFALLFVSPCFAYGAKGIESIFRSMVASLRGSIFRVQIHSTTLKAWLLIATILFSYFLFTSGWAWAVGMDTPTSPILDRQRMATSPDLRVKASYFNAYIIAEDIAGTYWLTSHLAPDRFLCADYASRYHVLTSYGGFSRESISAVPYACRLGNYVYLDILYTRYGIALQAPGNWTSYDLQLDTALGSRIFSNGATTIYSGG